MKYKPVIKNLCFIIGVISLLVAVVPIDVIVKNKDYFPIKSSHKKVSNINLSERHIHLASISAGEIAQGSIKIRNDGKKAIREITILSGCSCSSSDLSNTTINPGESIHVDFSINTNGKSGDFTNTFVIRYTEDGEKMFDVFYVTVPILNI